MRKLIYAFIAFILVLGGLGFYFYHIEQVSQKEERQADSEAYNAVLQFSRDVKDYHAISIPELKAKFERGESFYLFIGIESCPTCQNFVSHLKGKVSNPDEVYYIAFKQYGKDSKSNLRALGSLLETSKVPYFAKVRDGKTVSYTGDIEKIDIVMGA